MLREEQIAPGTDEQGPKDGLMGAGFAEKVLTNIDHLTNERPSYGAAGEGGAPAAGTRAPPEAEVVMGGW